MSDKCQVLFDEATELIDISLLEAAELFEDAAKCFDQESNRKLAAHSYSLAGKLYLDANKSNLSADCYGKAVLRQMMIENYEEANILLNIGKEHNFNTFHFRTAEESIAKKNEENISSTKLNDELIVEELDEIEDIPFEIEEIKLEEDLFQSLIIETKEKSSNRIDDDQIPTIIKGYRVSQISTTDTEMTDKRVDLIARSIISNERNEIKKSKLKGSAVASYGSDIRVLEPITSIKSLRDFKRENKEIQHDLIDDRNKNSLSEINETQIDSVNLPESSLIDLDLTETDINDIISIEPNFIGSSELTAEEELEDIELIDTIPYKFDVLDVETTTGVEFIEKKYDLKQKSMVYTWKISKLDIGEKAKIDYIMTSRVVRTAVAQIDDKMVLFNSYHSIEEENEQKRVNITFENKTGKNFNSVMIEDIIPPELVVREYKPEISPPPQKLVVADTIVYRWFFNNINPDETIEISYRFDSKAITRWYERTFTSNKGNIFVKKILQPIHHALNIQYIVVYIIESEIQTKLSIEDQIPSNFKVIATEPAYYHPKIKIDSEVQVLNWKFELEKDQDVKMAVRLAGDEIFLPKEPKLKFSSYNNIDREEIEKEFKKEFIDLKEIFYKTKNTE